MILQKFKSEILENVLNELEKDGYNISLFIEFEDWVRFRIDNKIMTVEKENNELKVWDKNLYEYKIIKDENSLKNIILKNYQAIEKMYKIENDINLFAQILLENFVYDSMYKTYSSLEIVKDKVTYNIDIINKKVESIDYHLLPEELDNIINGNINFLKEIKNNIIEIENLIQGE